MRELRTCAVFAVVVAASATASAQQATVTSTGGRTTGNITGTGGLVGGTTTGGTGLGGGSSLGGGGTGGTGSSGIASSPVSGGVQLQQLQTITAPTAPTGSNTSSLNQSNLFRGYYANPYYQGANLMSGTRTTSPQPGGFGQPLFNTSTGGTGAVTGRNTTTGLGTTGLGGRNALGGQNASTQSGILIPIPTQIAYTATMQFPTPPVAAGRIVADIRSVIDATPMIANSKAIQIITDANNNVTIRGTAKDDEEARLVEGLVRLTPGVGSIRNELAAPAVSVNR